MSVTYENPPPELKVSMGQVPRTYFLVTWGVWVQRHVSASIASLISIENGPFVKRLQVWIGRPVQLNPQGGSVLEMLGHVGTPLVHFSSG